MKAERGKDEALTLRAMPMTRDCVADIREIIVRARRSVVRHVNTTMTLAYWLIGRRIVVEEQKGNRRATYGEHLLQRISRELTADFGNGFGEPQLRDCRLFFRAFPSESEIRYTLCIKLSWSHLRDRELQRQIRMFAYERVVAHQVEDPAANPASASPTLKLPRFLMSRFFSS